MCSSLVQNALPHARPPDANGRVHSRSIEATCGFRRATHSLPAIGEVGANGNLQQRFRYDASGADEGVGPGGLGGCATVEQLAYIVLKRVFPRAGAAAL
jgi:hypothetical protein